MEDNAETDGLALFRVTLLGSAGCGKTSLISAFVNNFCPTVYTPTVDAAIYYKALSLPLAGAGPASARGLGHAGSMPVLAEIEDTCALRLDSADDLSDVRQFLSLGRSGGDSEHSTPRSSPQSTLASETSTYAPPLSNAEAPRFGRHAPVGESRMGFMIVYDSNDESSLAEAFRIHELLENAIWRQKGANAKPMVHLVANKIDKDPFSVEYARMRDRACNFASAKVLHRAEVSALEVKKVRQLFRGLLTDIRDRRGLWRRPGREPTFQPSMWQQAQRLRQNAADALDLAIFSARPADEASQGRQASSTTNGTPRQEDACVAQ
mmetsp:Transcript_40260/g.110759  ORF Transcript_40260/g.110759 Transcript_40260/m.110759 type:complete len:322 (-) Transcript_40260:9-974(-)